MKPSISLDNFNVDHPGFIAFPELDTADEYGLIGSGGNLSPSTLLSAYLQGIFPWFNQGQPILWWSPDPRLILRCNQFHLSKSLRKFLKKKEFKLSCNTAFTDIIQNCASSKWRRDTSSNGNDHTWITDEMIEAYKSLNNLGYAHSIEVWKDERLVGGLYGVSINNMFFGESMFSSTQNASKAALFYLSHFLGKYNCPWIDCQVESPHLISLGAELIDRKFFLDEINQQANFKHAKPIPWNKFASFTSSINI